MLWKKKEQNNTNSLPWEEAATQALEQAISQVPLPGPLKGKVKKELAQAAETHAREQEHTAVTAEDLMNGMLAKMPAGAREKIEQAMQQGPEGLDKLKKEFGDR